MSPSPFSALRALFRPEPAPAVSPEKPLAVRAMAPGRIGRGFRDPRQRKGVKRIVVTVEDSLFERVRADAVRDRVSLAALIRNILARHYAASPQKDQ